MATTNNGTTQRGVPVVPVPAGARSVDLRAHLDAPRLTMPYTCQTCAKRKVKCDKLVPMCSSCRKGGLECSYQAPLPRSRKRKLYSDASEKLALYERILHQHGLLPQNPSVLPSTQESPPLEPVSIRFVGPDAAGAGKLLAGPGKSRYIDNSLWRHLGDDEMQGISDEEEEHQENTGIVAGFSSDPLTGALMGFRQSLILYHPTHADAIVMCETHIENVEPICKILHIPSTLKIVQRVSQQPEKASKAEECLLFAIYHFAVFSITDENCAKKLGHSRDTLMQRYHFATRQALVNASFLKTTEILVLQALVLFLLSCRYIYDPHTYWILTGVAVRIAQRMGIHRDGEKLGLPPFDVQMRRRLFYQLLPLDGIASQLSGVSMGLMPDTWDTQEPLNINDSQIWPGMTETPEEQKGTTEMTFCLARSCIGKNFAKVGRLINSIGLSGYKVYEEAESVVRKAETEVEEKYIRYCDIVNPLHFLVIGMARAGIIALRIQILLPKVRNQTIRDAERRELFQLSQKIMDTDAAACAHTSLYKHQWLVKPFVLWGTWDSLTLVLTSLWSSDLFTPAEIDAAWNRVEQIYNNHGNFLESRRALYIAFGRLTLKAWDAKNRSSTVPEPVFITNLRSLPKRRLKDGTEREDNNATTVGAQTNKTPSTAPFPRSDTSTLFGSLSDGLSFDIGDDLNVDTADWTYWDRLIHDSQAQGE